MLPQEHPPHFAAHVEVLKNFLLLPSVWQNAVVQELEIFSSLLKDVPSLNEDARNFLGRAVLLRLSRSMISRVEAQQVVSQEALFVHFSQSIEYRYFLNMITSIPSVESYYQVIDEISFFIEVFPDDVRDRMRQAFTKPKV